MKKLIVAFFAVLVSLNAFAQFGIIGGLTSSSSDIRTAVAEIKKINQFHAGITYKFSAGNFFAFQPALQYNVKGTTLKTTDISSDINFKTGFIELPVQIQIGFGFGKVFRLFAAAEPFVGYAVSNELNWENLKNTSWDSVKNRFEYGLGLGGGLEFFRHVQLSVRYFWNFSELYGNTITWGDIKTTITSSKCNGISLSAAILF